MSIATLTSIVTVCVGIFAFVVSVDPSFLNAFASGHFTSTHAEEESRVTLPLKAKYFLRCPVSSHHAQYTWHHHESSTSCSWSEQWCLFLVDSMGPEQEGTYTCVSEEMGYRRELAQHELQVRGEAAGRWRSPLVWLCLAAALIQSWC